VRGIEDLGAANAPDVVTAAVRASSFRRPLHGVSLSLKDVRASALMCCSLGIWTVSRVTTLSGTWSVAGVVAMGSPEGGAPRMSSHRQRCLDIRRHSFDM
jgi:hypothetical protein